MPKKDGSPHHTLGMHVPSAMALLQALMHLSSANGNTIPASCDVGMPIKTGAYESMHTSALPSALPSTTSMPIIKLALPEALHVSG